MVAFETVALVVNLVVFSMLGRTVDVEMDGFVGFLVLVDTLDGLWTAPVVFLDSVASVLDAPSGALCTVWNVVRRVVCVVVSIVLVGFLVTNFVVFLTVLADVCVFCVLEITGVV